MYVLLFQLVFDFNFLSVPFSFIIAITFSEFLPEKEAQRFQNLKHFFVFLFCFKYFLSFKFSQIANILFDVEHFRFISPTESLCYLCIQGVGEIFV